MLWIFGTIACIVFGFPILIGIVGWLIEHINFHPFEWYTGYCEWVWKKFGLD